MASARQDRLQRLQDIFRGHIGLGEIGEHVDRTGCNGERALQLLGSLARAGPGGRVRCRGSWPAGVPRVCRLRPLPGLDRLLGLAEAIERSPEIDQSLPVAGPGWSTARR